MRILVALWPADYREIRSVRDEVGNRSGVLIINPTPRLVDLARGTGGQCLLMIHRDGRTQTTFMVRLTDQWLNDSGLFLPLFHEGAPQ